MTTLRYSIRRLAPVDTMLLDLGVPRARRLYADLAGRCKPDTHQNSLRDTAAMWRWLVKVGMVANNPWGKVEPIGRRTKGKPQLRVDEARQLVAHCLERQGEPGAVATLLALLLAMRIGEIAALTGRDIDDGGRLVWIERGKTANARRALEVPAVLRPALTALAKQAGPTGRLFPYTRNWITYWVATFSTRLGITRVTGHGLRGTHATLAVDAGATSHVVAGALGHGSTAVTEAHYIAPGTSERGRAGKVDRLVTATGTRVARGRN